MDRPSSSVGLRRLRGAALVAFLAVSSTVAGAVPQGRGDFRANVELVRLSVAVVNSSGGDVPRLSVDDFAVYDDGVPQRVELFLEPSEAALEVALVLDSSTSMRPVAGSTRRAALTFLAALEPDDCVVVLPFSERVGPGRRGRAADPRLRMFVDRVVAGGGTSLHDALLHSLDELERSGSEPTGETSITGDCPVMEGDGQGASERRRAIVLLSDGADENSGASFGEALLAARRASVPVFPVAFGYAYQDPRLETRLAELARATGGRRLQSATPERLRDAYAEALRYLKTSYVLGYHPDPRGGPVTLEGHSGPGPAGPAAPESSSGPGDLVWHEVRVELRRPLLEAIVRPGYYR